MSLKNTDSGSSLPSNPSTADVKTPDFSQKANAITPLVKGDTNVPPHQDSQTVTTPALDSSEDLFPVLRNPNFVTLWSSQVLSQVADKVYLVLMIALITEHYQSFGQSVSGWVSSIMIAFTIPAVIFGSLAGVMVDWWPKKRVLVLTNLLRGIFVLLLPLGFQWVDKFDAFWGIPLGFWLMLGVTLVVSTLTQFFAPAEQAVIPLIVEPKQLLSANSFYTLTMMAAVIVGFAAGDPLLSVMAQGAQHLGLSADLGRECLVGGGYFIAGLILLLVSIQETVEHKTQTFRSVWQDIQSGFNYIQNQAAIRSAVISLVMLFSIMAALAVLVVRLAEILPEIKTSQFGFLLTAGGAGMTLGLIFLSTVGDRFSRKFLSQVGSVILTGSLMGMVFAIHSLSISLLLLLGMGVGAALIGVPMQTIIQEQTPEEMRGKVFGLQNNLVNIALSLPLALAGIAENYFGIQWVFVGLTGLAVTSGLINWYISPTQVSS